MTIPRIDKLDKNLLINGNFRYSQRRGSVAATLFGSFNYIGPDRWSVGELGGWDVTPVWQRLEETPTGSNSRYCSRVASGQVNVSNTAGLLYTQRIESINALESANGPVSLAFEYSAHGFQEVRIKIGVANSIDDFSAITDFYDEVHSINNDQTWRTFELDNVTVPSTAGNGIYISMQFQNSDTFAPTALENKLGDVRLHVAKIARAYSFMGSDEVEELKLCRRYYSKSFAVDIFPQNGATPTTFNGNSDLASTSSMRASPGWAFTSFADPRHIELRETMRVAPNLTWYGNSSGQWHIRDTAAISTWLIPVTAGASTEKIYLAFGSAVNVNLANWAFGHYAADAEL